MGLLDVLNGMQNGPRGQKVPSPAGSGSSACEGDVANWRIVQLRAG
jgi:hypothetical protein